MTSDYRSVYASRLDDASQPNCFERLCTEFNADVVRRFAPAGARILDVGCNKGFLLGALPDYRTFGVDLSFGPLTSGSHYAIADGEWLPFGDGMFDVVVLAEVIEHLPDWRRVARECRRVLRPGGWLLLTHPNRHNLLQNALDRAKENRLLRRLMRRKAYSGEQHLRGYAAWESDRLWGTVGFEVAGVWTPMFGMVRALAPLYYAPRPPRALFPLIECLGRLERRPAAWLGRRFRTIPISVVMILRATGSER